MDSDYRIGRTKIIIKKSKTKLEVSEETEKFKEKIIQQTQEQELNRLELTSIKSRRVL